ncbi:ABC transporter ATP-binding protein [Thalassospira lucentensis]|uniref:ABC transporter ATP-binding protein n=1 Tax=Thalassospira lucentensis TaxID=168935 RepID=UPI00142DD528|nr:ABC transporter ATP-binding protein [Thalassospira lucentensis]NIZ00741.1 ABC transporter ATP-binding protein [Thalassospira lucentensis]
MTDQNLVIDRLTVVKSGKHIIDNVSCQFATGQLVGIIGPNGAGKSTLLSAVAGQGRYSGDIRWHGRRPDASDLGYMPQACRVSSTLTVLETVLLGSHERLGWRVSEADIERATAILDEFALAHLASRSMRTLSGGQQQLVLLSQRLVREPKLLVLDEATSALDLSHQISVLGMLRRYVAKQRALVLMAIHDLNVAMQYTDQLVLVDNGVLAGQDAPQNVLTQDKIKKSYGLAVDLVPRPNGRPVIAPVVMA